MNKKGVLCDFNYHNKKQYCIRIRNCQLKKYLEAQFLEDFKGTTTLSHLNVYRQSDLYNMSKSNTKISVYLIK